MAKIVYGLSGEGSGHSSRSRVIIRHLLKRGHIVKVASYKKGYKNLKDEFDVLEIEGLEFVIKDNKISPYQTIYENLANTINRYESSLVLKEKLFKEFKPDFVITDFEPMTAFFASQFSLPLITIDNQHRLRYQVVDLPADMLADALIAENFIRLMIPRPDVSLITTFYFSKLKNDRSFLFPPILDERIFKLKPAEKDYILVYATANFDSLFELLRQYKREKFFIFGSDRTGKSRNLNFIKTDRESFLDYLANAKAVIGTAGFTLITESLYFKKPYFALPIKSQFEQLYNAYLLQKSGYGYFSKKLNKTILSAFLYDLPELKQNLKSYKSENNKKIYNMLDDLIKDNMKILYRFYKNRRGILSNLIN